MGKITSTSALRDIYALPGDRAVRKQLSALDKHCMAFIAKSPFLLLATRGEDGLLDVSPRGDHPGFVTIEGPHSLILPDRPGNNRLDSLQNIVAHPEVALIFLLPGVDETLRVNGRAELRDDPDLLEAHAAKGKLPKTVTRVTVEQAYLHCAKALMRSALWDPEGRIDRSEFPSMGQMLKDQIRQEGPAETQEEMVERYRETMY